MEGIQFIVMCLVLLECKATEDVQRGSQSLIPQETTKKCYSIDKDTKSNIILKREVRSHPTDKINRNQLNKIGPVDANLDNLLRKHLNPITKPVAKLIPLSTPIPNKHLHIANVKELKTDKDILNDSDTEKAVEKFENKTVIEAIANNKVDVESKKSAPKDIKSVDEEPAQKDDFIIHRMESDDNKNDLSKNSNEQLKVDVKVLSGKNEIPKTKTEDKLQEGSKINISVKTSEPEPDENNKTKQIELRLDEPDSKLETTRMKLFGVVFPEKLKHEKEKSDLKPEEEKNLGLSKTEEYERNDANNTIVITNQESQEYQEKHSRYQPVTNTEQPYNTNQFWTYNPHYKPLCERGYFQNSPYKANYNYYLPYQVISGYSNPSNYLDMVPENRVYRTWKNTEINIKNNQYGNKPIRIDVQQKFNNGNEKLGGNMQYSYQVEPLINGYGCYSNHNTRPPYPSVFSNCQYA